MSVMRHMMSGACDVRAGRYERCSGQSCSHMRLCGCHCRGRLLFCNAI